MKPLAPPIGAMSNTRVLLVEDSGFMATHTSGTLESVHGMTVRIAGTAREARTLLADGGFDCLVVNTQLPDQIGIEFVRSVRSDDGLPAVPAILFTSGDLETVAGDAFAAGVVDVVSKDHHAGSSMEVFANRIEVAIDAFERRKRLGTV
jgi:CheY-like chemotaxis protein